MPDATLSLRLFQRRTSTFNPSHPWSVSTFPAPQLPQKSEISERTQQLLQTNALPPQTTHRQPAETHRFAPSQVCYRPYSDNQPAQPNPRLHTSRTRAAMINVPMRMRLFPALSLLTAFAAATLRAQAPAPPPPQSPDLRIVSEFQRFTPFGSPLPQDREFAPREILSPALARNGHLSLHVIVTGPTGTNYFLYAGTNPPGSVTVRLYREWFVPCGAALCPDWLTEQPSGTFGAIPESVFDKHGQTTRVYLLDVWAPPSAPPGRVRVEAQLKSGTWLIAPMEVRVVDRVVPEIAAAPSENIAPLEAPSSATAGAQLLRYSAGLPPQSPPALLRVRDIIQRNAAEDMALAHSRGIDPLELYFAAAPPFAQPVMGPEWYLRVRDLIYR